MFRKLIARLKGEDAVARGIANDALDRLLRTERSVDARFDDVKKYVNGEIAALRALIPAPKPAKPKAKRAPRKPAAKKAAPKK